MKSFDTDPNSKYKSVLTQPDRRNFQMFAYCPTVSHKVCGIADDDQQKEMVLGANTNIQKVSTNAMKYVPTLTRDEAIAGIKQREYDFCHYLIKKAADV